MIAKLFNRVIDILIAHAMKTPFWHLPGYMERYWLVPFAPTKRSGHGEKEGVDGVVALSPWRRPFGALLQRLGIAVRLHHILRSDKETAYHDHPWAFVSIILRGGYWERTPAFIGTHYVGENMKWYGPGRILFRSHKSLHRLELPEGQTTWSLFITFKWRHVWGFVSDPRSGVKVPYPEYLGLDTPKEVKVDLRADMSQVTDALARLGRAFADVRVDGTVTGRKWSVGEQDGIPLMQRREHKYPAFAAPYGETKHIPCCCEPGSSCEMRNGVVPCAAEPSSTERTEKQWFMVEAAVFHGFKTIDDDGEKYECTADQIIALLTPASDRINALELQVEHLTAINAGLKG